MADVIVSLLLLAVLAVVVLVEDLLMPMSNLMVAMLGLIVVFIAFAVFVFKERAADEREHQHMMLAGRASFLAGAAVLVAGVVIQSFRHDVDPWLVYALAVMVLAKLITRIYENRRH
jgi:cbb3-type cytochrome oxidase cytochrome c subunit